MRDDRAGRNGSESKAWVKMMVMVMRVITTATAVRHARTHVCTGIFSQSSSGTKVSDRSLRTR
jgi:hypothetical protein